MTSFILKIIALVTMVFDHIKYSIPATDNFITQYFGRISFPLFAFLITEGYIHTKSKSKYIKRLLIFAIISQVPFTLFRTLVADKFLLNILFTFLLAILGIIIFDFFKNNEQINKIIGYIIIGISFFVIATIGTIIPVDYGWFGIVSVWVFYILKSSKFATCLGYIALVIIYYYTKSYPLVNSINLISVCFTIIPALLILFYNGKEGKKIKYLFYFFYPIHMIILYGISLIL